MPLNSKIPTPSLPLTTQPNQENGIPQRPPHPLILKAIDSQIHLLFKAWIHYAYSLPLKPQLGAGELYSQMDARVQIFAVITYEFNRLIADFSLEYGKDHPCLKETSTKDVSAYSKCVESDIAKLCDLWNEYSEAFEEKFRQARRERLPKQQANLMKEELSRLLYVSRAMEKVWLDGEQKHLETRKCSDKDEGIKRWIADTSSHLQNDRRVRLEKTLMQKVLEANKAASERFVEELRERLQRRRHAILNNNYVEAEDFEKGADRPRGRQMQEQTTRVLKKKTSPEVEFSTSLPTPMTDSLWDGEGNRVSESSYDEFDINDLRYLTPMLFPRPPTPMAPLVTKPLIQQHPATPRASNAVPVLPPPDYPPPSLPYPPDLPRAKCSATIVTPSPPCQNPHSLRTGNTAPAYPASLRSCSTGSSILATIPNGDPRFSLKSLFSKSRSRTVSSEAAPEKKPAEPVDAVLAPQRTLTPPPHAPFKSIPKPHSMASLRSPQRLAPILADVARPPEIPAEIPNQSHECQLNGVFVPNLEQTNTGRRPYMTASLYEPAGDSGWLSRPGDGIVLSQPVGTMLRPKGSMLFNGRIVKEVPKGEEDPFLELHAFRGEPF
ncbi:hypothetical protein L211DRAFT_864981 [Terfezia boudieri ATCC MYA-4762]|uniref:Uncharacterized protein n=1 Tax=Terfezia boudieri ATCC MYA-4762 TaxID=1051890 RepID=A0A3N4M6Q3_9PEZI|nr:hypothetical protein L211DRAFT_864981 [Terfezia boudieri ATCC MYA-4762]